MAEPYLGEIILFAGNFAPNGWMFCQGQILNINTNTALFSILGTTYGGNGTQTFALPDLRSRVPVGTGQGTGLSNVALGQVAGSNSVTITATNLPSHSHSFSPQVSSATADQTDPTGAIPAAASFGARPSTAVSAYTKGSSTGTGAVQNTGVAGGNQPLNVAPPYLGLNYIIAIQGIYPSRS